MENFFVNQKYHKQFSTDFLSLSFDFDLYREYIEFNALAEFNKIKNKEFIPFTSFTKFYREAIQ